jgi:hypothetical protein
LTSAKLVELRASQRILRRGSRQMQAPTVQEAEQLDQMDIVIGLSDEEARYLLHVWRICADTAPKQVTDEFRRKVRARREVM